MNPIDNLNLQNYPWWNYIESDLQELLLESQVLLAKAETMEAKFHDYAFIVFPAAKAYEGFLKKVFLDLGFISENDYFGKHFRVGKALNPSLDRPMREQEGVYDKIVEYCGGKNVADTLWDTWKESRNLIFHWFPNERNRIDFVEARERITMIINAMNILYNECKIKKS